MRRVRPRSLFWLLTAPLRFIANPVRFTRRTGVHLTRRAIGRAARLRAPGHPASADHKDPSP